MPKTRNHLTPAEAEAKGLLCCKHLKERHRLMPGLNTRPGMRRWRSLDRKSTRLNSSH